MLSRLSLRWLASLWVVLAMAAGGGGVWLWMASQAAWQTHLDRAYIAGLALHDSLENRSALPAGVTMVQQGAAPSLPNGWRETLLTLTGGGRPDLSRGARLSIRVQSPDIQYPVAEVQSFGGGSQAAGLASVTRTLARFCSTPRLFVQFDTGPWMRIEGAAIWGCDAAPPDRRLLAALVLAGALILLLGWVAEVSGAFAGFAAALRDHRARNAALPVGGVEELRQTAEAVNAYVAQDRAALENRALVLSGVSHDLGTPATRLRLRSTLIEDDTLRSKLEHDIDEMTTMIEGVLTYTRAEIGAEPFRQLSLTSLAEAVVADYQDVDMPVRLVPAPIRAARAGTLFARSRRQPVETHAILMRGQPTSLRRALSNLIDNALKYGREAEVMVDGDADDAWITVTDRGSVLTEEDLARLTGAFQRGGNAGTAPGVGLGLAIVSTIAAQHGGRLEFFRADQGLAAKLVLCRRWA
ncbi:MULTISPECIES: sensor histidine kinase [Paracoccus]|jgi:signal transduction histidine kinase|uniref:histidine kinase n=1 Tax=Paracoccus denitrificans (strain Pd 1222) TaxID=318586 RepID=A1B7H9_PARDP|nr:MULTISPECIES: ATP-binding protein [Paracoccus]ABL71473.1 integral membrane sensor signal transduction histidine kinase [Paracoccus denitrificans PD1222]MBB4629673.1 signal transduction histidine kinase [Paracoccus denitrificans]MCU7430687.1 ATP-binding protein [Paracoccus denitrificans]MDK8874835.1 ATP-binding protein [Paracoccus sp. SSJ]QAR28080.1 two-component sensor histidine kinase [Paracoccus denitrificans]